MQKFFSIVTGFLAALSMLNADILLFTSKGKGDNTALFISIMEGCIFSLFFLLTVRKNNVRQH